MDTQKSTLLFVDFFGYFVCFASFLKLDSGNTSVARLRFAGLFFRIHSIRSNN